MTPESRVLHRTMLDLGSRADMRLWRNNTGQAWQGKPVRRGTTVSLLNARAMHMGLCTGSADLIGIKRVTVTQEMVGVILGQFVGLECKSASGRVTEDQERWLALIRDMGGIGMLVRGQIDYETL